MTPAGVEPTGGEQAPSMPTATIAIYGVNPVRELLRARPTQVESVLILAGQRGGGAARVAEAARRAGVRIDTVPARHLERIAVTPDHQGVVALAPPIPTVGIPDILEIARARREEPLLAVLDEITDPRNLGSIIRSAEVLGLHGLVMGRDRASALTPVVHKASAGAIEYLALARVPNVAAALALIRRAGVWVVGTGPEYAATAESWDFRLPTAIVFGAEGRGMRRLIEERCDACVKIPVRGQVQALNVAVAAGILFSEAVRQRRPSAAS